MTKQQEWDNFSFTEKLDLVKLFPEEAKTDRKPDIRLEYFRHHDFPEEAKNDKDWEIRLEYYRFHKFPIEAKKDKHWYVRLAYYEHCGFTKEALNDSDPAIRQQAKIYLDYVKNQKKLNQ